MIPCLFGQALGQRSFRPRRGNEKDFVEGVLAHAGHCPLVLLLFLRGQTAFQHGKEGLCALLPGQADDSAHMAHLGHIEDAQKGCGLLGGTAGVEDDEGLLGQDADAAAVLHSGKARQNGLIGDLEALPPEGQRQLDCDGGIARRVTAKEGQRRGVSAVVHPAGEFFRLKEGDVLGVGHHKLALRLGRGHHQLAQDSLRLLRRGDADRAFPHDARRQRGQTLHRTTHAVGADGCDGADRHTGQGSRQTGIRQLHHSQLTACRTEAAGRSRQLCRCAGQRLCGAEGLCGLTEQHRVHRHAADGDAGRQRLASGTVEAGVERCLPQDRRQQTGGSGLARRTGHTDELHLPGIRRQGSAQLLRRGKALGQRGKIFVCLFDGHCVNPHFDVCRADSTSCTGPDRTSPPECRSARRKNPARHR